MPKEKKAAKKGSVLRHAPLGSVIEAGEQVPLNRTHGKKKKFSSKNNNNNLGHDDEDDEEEQEQISSRYGKKAFSEDRSMEEDETPGAGGDYGSDQFEV